MKKTFKKAMKIARKKYKKSMKMAPQEGCFWLREDWFKDDFINKIPKPKSMPVSKTTLERFSNHLENIRALTIEKEKEIKNHQNIKTCTDCIDEHYDNKCRFCKDSWALEQELEQLVAGAKTTEWALEEFKKNNKNDS